jgi:hypothetical protein
VYACLVCGKYYQGRGLKSHAYTHSLEAGHHVFINLQTEKVYCLPDGYEINDPSLEDIRHVLNPRWSFTVSGFLLTFLITGNKLYILLMMWQVHKRAGSKSWQEQAVVKISGWLQLSTWNGTYFETNCRFVFCCWAVEKHECYCSKYCSVSYYSLIAKCKCFGECQNNDNGSLKL